MSDIVPGKFTMESPNLSETAIKLGLLGLYQAGQLKSELPADKQDLYNCVSILSSFEASDYETKCGDDAACFEHIPPLSRNDLINLIKQAQSPDAHSAISNAKDKCKNIDVTKL